MVNLMEADLRVQAMALTGFVRLSIMFFFFMHAGALSQPDTLLQTIANQQTKQDSFYATGLFPTQLVRGRTVHADNNVFYTALTLYTLKNIRQWCTPQAQVLVDSMICRAWPTFANYQNRQGGITYNFYPTKPDRPFPGIPWLARSKRGLLPDDVDDTSLIYLVQNTPDSLNRAVKKLMTLQSGKHTPVKSTYKQYQNSQAYRTWFADNMKQDLDVCVMANVLLFVGEKKLTLEPVDYETVSLLKDVIANGIYKKRPYLISSHYQDETVILYHLARVVAIDSFAWGIARHQLIADVEQQLKQTDHAMEKVVLISSLFRMGKRVTFRLASEEINRVMPNFFWFKASPLYGSAVGVKKLLGKRGLYQLKYRSIPYYQALLLEFMLLTNAQAVTDEFGRHWLVN
jgi:hypothetical protein